MARRSRSVSRLALVAMIGAVLDVASQFAVAQVRDEYYTFQFHVYCRDAQVPSTIFFVRGTGSMGTSPAICLGWCKGRTVSIAEATTGLSSGVSSGLTAKYAEHERNAAAGNGRSVAECIRGENTSKCDETGACGPITKALEAVDQARTSVGSWQVRIDKLKASLPPLLEQIAGATCKDNQYPHYELHEIRLLMEQLRTYNSASPGANTIKNTPELDEMTRHLKNLDQAVCKGGHQSTETLPCAPPSSPGGYADAAPPLYTGHLSEKHKQRVKEILYNVSWGEFMPSEPCPGCVWQLLSKQVEEISTKPEAGFTFSTIWRCPSTNRVLQNHGLRK